MLTTFVTTTKTLLRRRDVLLWAVAFPLVLATLIHTMLGGLDEHYQLEPIDIVVVDDASYAEADGLSDLVSAMAADDATDAGPLFSVTYVDSQSEAEQTLAAGSYYGYIQVVDGEPVYTADSRKLELNSDPSQNIVKILLDRYQVDYELVAAMIQDNPQRFANADFIAQLTSDPDYIERVSISENPASDSLLYMFSVLAFSVIMMTTFSLSAIEAIQPRSSALGARRSSAGQSKLRLLFPTLGAAWLVGLLVLLVTFIYIRFGFGVSFGGKDLQVVATLAVGSLTVTFLGALISTFPVAHSIKSGTIAMLSCVLSLFAGLYGPFAQSLGDSVANNYPILAKANPARAITDALFSLYYYDGYTRFFECITALLILAVIFFFLSVFSLRRQRYASL
ncbi:MAG: ABC transporter permease [Propionibacteriaceae bacterium]|jgi:ABC-type multidrug transport system permease subunit|nr:ABC transporter permease [Propionibacteriaceae bacterium]